MSGQIIQTSLEAKIEAAKCWVAHWEQTSIANGGSLDLTLQTPDTPSEIHLQAIVLSTDSGPDEILLYEAPTASEDGTLITARCKNRNNPQDSPVVLRGNPTVSAVGTEIDDHLIFASGNKVAIVDAGQADEWVLKKNTKYLIRFQNQSGGQADAQVHITYYENYQ